MLEQALRSYFRDVQPPATSSNLNNNIMSLFLKCYQTSWSTLPEKRIQVNSLVAANRQKCSSSTNATLDVAVHIMNTSNGAQSHHSSIPARTLLHNTQLDNVSVEANIVVKVQRETLKDREVSNGTKRTNYYSNYLRNPTSCNQGHHILWAGPKSKVRSDIPNSKFSS